MFLAIRREGQTVTRMQEVGGEAQERVLAVDEFGNESWVPTERLTGGAAAEQQQVLEVEEEEALEVEVEAEQETTPSNTTAANDNSTAEVVDARGGRVPSYFLTTAGAGCAFVLLWIAGGMVGGFFTVLAHLGLVSPDVMVGAYSAGAVFWFGGYLFVYLPWWYRSQPWVPCKAVVLVPSRDRRGRVQVDRQGRVITEEQERLVTKEIRGEVFVKAWRPFNYTWLRASDLGLTEEEVREQRGQN